MRKAIIYKCAVNGWIGPNYETCKYLKSDENSTCGAHGLFKCKHKSRHEQVSIAQSMVNDWRIKDKGLMLKLLELAYTSFKLNGEDKLYTFKDGSVLQVREITNDWQVFK